MSKFINNFVNIVFIVFSGLITLSMFMSISKKFGGLVATVGVVLMLAIMLILFLFFTKKFTKILKSKIVISVSKLSIRQLVLIIFAFSFISKTIFVLLLGNDANLHPDMKMYLSFSNQIANNGVIEEYVPYAVKHGYTFIFGLFLSPVSKLFGSSTEVLNIYMSLLLSIASVLLFDIVRRYVDKTICFIGIMIYNLLPIGLFQTQLLIHENAILFFHILSFWLFLKFFDTKYKFALRIVFLVLASLAISFGTNINMSGLIIIISFVIYSIVVLCKKCTVKNFGKLLCIILALSVSMFVVGKMCQISKNNLISKSAAETVQKRTDVLPFGLGWGLYVGFNYDSSGTISEGDSETYYKSFDNKDEEAAYKNKLIIERIDNCAENPIKLVNHFLNKMEILWGTPFLPFSYEQGNAINEFIYSGIGGMLNKLLNFSNMFFLLFVYFMIFVGSFRNRFVLNKNAFISLHFKMVIIGVTLLFLFVEVTPKYTSHLPMIMFAIWILSLENYKNNAICFSSLITKRFNLKNK